MRCDYIFYFKLKSVQKVFKTNPQLNIYPHNILFYNNLGVYTVIIHIAIWLHDMIKTSKLQKLLKYLFS